MIGGVTRKGGYRGLRDRVTLSAGVKFCHVNVSTRLAGVRFVIHQIRAKFTVVVALHYY